jgi:hypothetical protein
MCAVWPQGVRRGHAVGRNRALASARRAPGGPIKMAVSLVRRQHSPPRRDGRRRRQQVAAARALARQRDPISRQINARPYAAIHHFGSSGGGRLDYTARPRLTVAVGRLAAAIDREVATGDAC